jgi:hypothetical protein
VWNATLKTYRQDQENGTYERLPAFCKNCLDWQSAYCNYEEVKND